MTRPSAIDIQEFDEGCVHRLRAFLLNVVTRSVDDQLSAQVRNIRFQCVQRPLSQWTVNYVVFATGDEQSGLANGCTGP